MKNSTFSAQVANNLLTVLQGYSKTIRLLLVMFLTLTASTAWGATDVILWNGSSPSYQASTTEKTSTDGAIKWVNSAGNTYSNPTRIYSGNTLTISVANTATTKITKIVAVCTSNDYASAFGGTSVNVTGGGTASRSVSGSTTTITITGKATSVAMKMSAQSRVSKLTVTYETAAATKYTVTLNAGSGTCAASVTEASAGAGVTLPTPTLDCGDWEFAGWKTTSAVTTETTTEPTLIPAGAYSPTSDITLYAVYQRTETTSGGGGGSTEVTFNFGYTDWGKAASFSGTTYDTVEQNDNGVSVTYTRNDGSLYANTTSLRLYKTNTLTFDAGSNTITSITFTGNIGQSDITTDAGTCTNTTNTLSWAGSSKSVTFTRPSNASSYATLTSATLTIGGGSTTYYHSTPDCGSTASTYTLTLDSDLSCVTDGSATVELNATELTNFTPATRDGFTCSGYWSAPSGGVKVLNADGTFAATSVQDYITDGKWTNEGNVTLTPRWECSNTMTLSVGTQSGGTYSLSKTSLETCDCTDTKRQVTITATPNSGYSVTDISYSGDGTATKVSGPTVNGNNTEWVYQFNQGDNGTGTFTVTFTTIPTYTITLDAGSGTCDDESLTETSGGAGVTLPIATPSATCQSEGWTFAGWAEASVATETEEAPTTLYEADDTYKPTSDITLYAVYQRTETTSGGGGGNTSVTFTDEDSGGWTTTAGEQNGTKDGVSISTNNGIYSQNNNQLRVYKDATFTVSSENIITSIVFSSSNYEWSSTSNGVYSDKTWTGNTKSVTFTAGNGQVRITQLVVTVSAGGGSTTYYHSTPDCVASWSITYNFEGGTGSHCSNTSVPQGGSYTICDEAPTKEGNIFLHWSDGVNTYNPSDVIATVTTDITLTAVWQPNTYTVIWSNNGVETGVPYNHGDALVVPTAPASCDGVKEFVGWTTHSGYYHATTAPDDIFTTKTTPVTAPATYYAVFATKGAGGTEFVLGESGTFKMYANVNGTNYYAQGGVSSNKLSSTTDILTASDYILTYADGSYTIKQGTSAIGHSSKTDLSTTASTWTISAGANGSWRITSDKDNSRALSYSAEANAFKAYATSNLTAGNETYFDIEFGSGSDAHSDYTTICQTVESIEIANYTTEFFVTDEFAFGGTVTAHFDEGEPQDVTALAHFSGYNMNEVGTYTVTVTYMGATATYEITVKPLDNAWVLTWNVSGKTNTGLGPRSVTKGSAIGTLPTPEVPAACAGKTFMGWTESNIVPSDGKGIVYITEATVPTKNTTYYAVFATVNNFCTQKPIDQITNGSKVVIVAVASLDAGGTTGKAISSRTAADGNNLASDDVFVLDEQINTPHSTCVWTLTREDGKYIFTQDGKYLNAVVDPDKEISGFCKCNLTKDTWTISEISTNTYRMLSSNQNKYVEWFTATGVFKVFNVANTFGTFDMQFFVTANANGGADITDYTTGCAEYTITYYGFHGGYSTSCSSDGTIVLPVNSLHTVPNCGNVVNDHTNLGREFLNVWMTQPHGGHTFKPGDTFILTQDTTLYAQWKMETTSDVTTLPTDIEDLAGTDIYVYGGTTLNIQPGTTTINSLTLKGGLQADGSYKMPTVWVPEGATLVRNSNKINLDLIVNAKTWYPFAVPFAAKNNENVEYLDPVLAAASYYGTHFAIKTYDGARRAKVGEDKANNWVRVLRDSTLQPGVGYIITALTYPDKDTATIRIPMTVPNTWFQNGEQAAVSTTVRNTIAVTAHAGAAATEHQRHAGWNFVANPYLTSFAGGNVANDGGLDYINGELIIQGSYEYLGEDVPYVTVPAYDFAYYSQHKLSDVKLSPEWSFFVQVGTGGTMNFTTAGRQQAPASIAARNAEERPVKMDVDLILSDNHNSDQTGIIICDRYSDAYEIGRDLEKLFGSAYNLSVYTLMEDNTPLAFQALAIRSSMQVIPVGYRAPEQGEYTFRLNEATSSIDLLNEQYEQLVLVDYQTGELTNLLYTDYTFYSERTQSNSRFAIYAVPRQNAPTDLPNAIGSDEEVRKVIYNDRLYILRDGNVYNGMGQKM